MEPVTDPAADAQNERRPSPHSRAGAPVALGVNYTPRRGWFHSWLDLDLGEISEDLAQIAELGLDHVRLFPLWPILQPHRSLIRTSAIDDVAKVVDIAAEHGLNATVDVLQGHLSSFDFLPSWVSTWHRRNIFTDPDVVGSQQELARALGSGLAGRENLVGLTLGNEIGQFARPDHPDCEPLTPEQAIAWNAGMLGALEEVMPAGLHHHCFDDALWFTDAHPFTPKAAVEQGHATTIHSWVFTGPAQRLGAGHPGLAHFGRYLIEVADYWHHRLAVPADRTMWLQEIGAPAPSITAEQAPEFATTSIRSAIGNDNVNAVTWWCSHDVSRSLVDYPELEYSLGLFDSDGNLKPVGEAIGALAREQRENGRIAPLGAPEGQDGDGSRVAGAQEDPIIIPALAEDGSDRSLLAPAGEVYAQWTEEALAGRVRPLRAEGTTA